jgi:hypothetical protein
MHKECVLFACLIDVSVHGGPYVGRDPLGQILFNALTGATLCYAGSRGSVGELKDRLAVPAALAVGLSTTPHDAGHFSLFRKFYKTITHILVSAPYNERILSFSTSST